MPEYDYECKACEHFFSVKESMKSEPQTVCPKCLLNELRRVVLKAPRCKMVEVKTVDQLAEKNWKNMGRYEKEDRLHADNYYEKKAMREETERINKIAKLDSEGQKKYIETGVL